MFVFLALIAFVNYKKNAFIKEETNPSGGNVIDPENPDVKPGEGDNNNPDGDNTIPSEGSNSPEGDSNNSDGDNTIPSGDNDNADGENTTPELDVSSSEGDILPPDHGGDVKPPSEIVGGKISGNIKFIFENLNDLLNDGLNKATFYKYLDNPSEFLDDYHFYINLILNESYVPFPNYYNDSYITSFFDVDKTLHSIDKKVESFLKDGKEMFQAALPILSELGSDLAKIANIEYSTIESLYKYILINTQNDGVKFGEIAKILGISTNWVPQMKKIMSVFEAGKPISDLFDGFNVKKEYKECLEKIKKLDVPNDNNTRFFSINLATDVASSLFKLVRTAYNNFAKTYYDDPVLPTIKKYVLKSINIFDVSIYDRANSLSNLINKVQKYSSACEKEGDLEVAKCAVFQNIELLFADMFCSYEWDDEENDYIINQTCRAETFDNIKRYISDYTVPEINVTDIFLKRYGIERDYVSFYAGLVANLTDSTKSFQDILEGTKMILPYVEVLKDVYYPEFVDSILDTVDFIATLDDSSNFKDIINSFNLRDYWTQATQFVREISNEKPICNLSFIASDSYEYEKCQSLTEKINRTLHYINSDNETFEQFGEVVFYKTILDSGIPIAKGFDQPLSKFLKLAYENLIPMLNNSEGFEEITFQKTVEFSNSIKKLSGVVDEFFTLFDDLMPLMVKELPVLNQYYPIFIQKSHEILNAFNSDQSIPSIINSFYDGISVIFNMIQNAAGAFNGYNTKFSDLIKAAKPTTFLNIQETLNKLSQIKEYTLKNIAEAITYDGSNSVARLLAGTRTLKLNDVAPYKSLVLHSGELYTSLSKNRLGLETISKCLARSKDEIKELLSSFISPILSVPQKSVQKSIVFYARSNDNEVNSILEKIRSLAGSIAAGRKISTQTSSIVVTPMATPAATVIPPPDDYVESTPLGTIEVEKDATAEDINNQINEILKNVENKDDVGHFTWPHETLNFNKDIDLKGQSIEVPEGGTINYENGDLKLQLDTKEVTINAGDASEVKLAIRKDKSSSSSTIKIETKSKSVKITSDSDINAPVVISVPEDVTSVTVKSVKIHDKASISAIKGETPMKVTVNSIDASANSDTTLSNVVVAEEFKVKQFAKINLEDVQFSENSKVSLALNSYEKGGFDSPIFTGKLQSPPSQINLNIQSGTSGSPQPNTDYTIFSGTFTNGCEDWRKVVITDGTGFNDKVCTPFDGASPLKLDSEDAALSLRNNQKKPDDKNKLSAGQIAGIVVGCVAGVAIIVAVVVIVVLKKKKKDQSSNEDGKEEAEL